MDNKSVLCKIVFDKKTREKNFYTKAFSEGFNNNVVYEC